MIALALFEDKDAVCRAKAKSEEKLIPWMLMTREVQAFISAAISQPIF